MRFLLFPFSLLLGMIVFIREKLYDFGVLRSYQVGCKVISVGNLTFGGTGKTPVVDFLLNQFKGKNKKVCVLSRGYGRNTKGFLMVNPEGLAAEQGDEPTLLAWNHKEVPIFVCEDRVEGCRQILAMNKFDVIIADDAFQHRRLKRDLDIIVMDATEDFANYCYPPMGRARNSMSYLKRADLVFLTKTNLVSPEKIEAIKNKISNILKKNSRKDIMVVDVSYEIEKFYEINFLPHVPHSEDVYLLSGIAKPDLFEKSIRSKFPNLKIKKHFKFKDHYNYKKSDIELIRAEIKNATLITTEKDAVKLKEYKEWISVARLELKISEQNCSKTMDFIYGRID